MKHLLLTTIAAVLLVGCGRSVDIWEAAEYGNIETIKHHLANGTDVNVQDFDGWTPLHWAAMEGHKKTAELLIANGADVNLKDNLGWTALLITDHKKIAELLIANGADVNLKNMDGNTPLQYAAMAGQTGIAKLLLIKEADLNTKNINGKRPLDWAMTTEIADLLRKHGGKTGRELKAEGK
jgi:ankyrin repeat protein